MFRFLSLYFGPRDLKDCEAGGLSKIEKKVGKLRNRHFMSSCTLKS
jgi:hypothetical protein